VLASGVVFAALPSRASDIGAESCRDALKSFFKRNPEKIQVGVAHVHSYKLDADDGPYTVSVVVPAPFKDGASKIADLVQADPKKPWPERFVISDGDPGSQMILVDQRPGSSLSIQLDGILADMQKRGIEADDTEAILKDLRDNTKQYYESFKANYLRGHQDPVLKTKPQDLGDKGLEVFQDFMGKKPSAKVIGTGETRPAVPFEHYFAKPEDTMCFHNALLASLLLQRLRIPHRFRTGFAAEVPSYENTGHSLIEVADGRMLDPTWSFLKPIKKHAEHPDWIRGASWWWTPHDHYPYLIME